MEETPPCATIYPSLIAVVSFLACDSPMAAPPDPAVDGDSQASADQSVTIDLWPPAAFLIKTEPELFRATVMIDGEWVDTATVDWFVSDTTVAHNSGNGWVWAMDDGFAVILASWGGTTAAAAIVVDTPADSVSVSIVNSRYYQSVLAPLVEGDSVLLRVFARADRE